VERDKVEEYDKLKHFELWRERKSKNTISLSPSSFRVERDKVEEYDKFKQLELFLIAAWKRLCWM